MTLEEIKKSFKSVADSHKIIKSFDYGEDSLIAVGKWTKYPLLFLEIPYNTTYEVDHNKFKTYQFALCILIGPSFDNVKTDHERISLSETIGDAIITKLQKEEKRFKFDSVSGISLREFSSAGLSGYRYDLTIRTARECFDPSDFNS